MIIKKRQLCVIMALASVLLIAFAILLTHRLFELSIPSNKETSDLTQDTASQTKKSSTPSVINESVIEIEDEEPASDQGPKKTLPKKTATQSKHDEKNKFLHPSKTPPTEESKVATSDIPLNDGIGYISDIRGDALLIKTNGKSISIVKGYVIHLNDRIETSSNSRLEIRFNDDSTLSQGENSIVILDKYTYDKDKKDKNSFGMRFLKGSCRIISGMITKLNPDKFKVHTKMATIGIRGCEVGFESLTDIENILVLNISQNETINIATSDNGQQIIDTHSGQQINITSGHEFDINITESNTKVTLSQGKIPQRSPITSSDINRIRASTSVIPPAFINVYQQPGVSVFNIQPQDQQPPKTTGARQ